MTTRRTEPIIKKERVAVYVSLGLAFAAIAAIVPVMSTTAYAAQPVDANCWGDVTQDFAQEEDEQPGIGEHASNPPPAGDDPARVGIPNVLDELGGGVPTPRDPNHPSEVGEAVANC
jgi:hypothetical protein